MAWLAHLGFGAPLGAFHDAVLPKRSSSALLRGTLYGAAVWAINYAGWLPAAGIMPSPSADRRYRPTAMLAAHIVFGCTLAGLAAYRERAEGAPLRRAVSLLREST